MRKQRKERILERKVVFLGRDGVINVPWHDENDDRMNYVMNWEDFEFIEYSECAIRCLLAEGYVVVVVTNQACIGKGYCDEKVMKDIVDRMWTAIHPPPGSRYGTIICPHTEKDDCVCRKPKPGMIFWGAFMYGLCLKEAWMVGDSRSDMQAAWTAGIRKRMLIDDELEALVPLPASRRVASTAKATNLAMAVEYIMEVDK